MNDTDIICQLNELTEKLDQLKSQIRVGMRSCHLTIGKKEEARIKLARTPYGRRFVSLELQAYDKFYYIDITSSYISINNYHVSKNEFGYPSKIELDAGRITSYAHRSPISWCIGGSVHGVYLIDKWLHIMLKKPKSEIELGFKKNAFCILRNKDRKPLTMGKKERDKPF